MIKHEKKLRANDSGQLLIVAALAIALLISSTTIYVYELSGERNEDTSSFSDFVLSLKQTTQNAMISSLANISNGGVKSVLASDLNEFSQALANLRSGIYHLEFTLKNDSQYDSGVWLSWNISGSGVSSVYSNFTLTVQTETSKMTMPYAVNITTAVAINGSYAALGGGEKLVSLTCRVYNEGKPALARSITVFYENLGGWTQANSSNNLAIEDYDDGTYGVSFIVNTASDTVNASVHVFDLRGVYVQANVTCSSV